MERELLTAHYERIAQEIINKGNSYYSNIFYLECEDGSHIRFSCTCLIYRIEDKINDVIWVWWECIDESTSDDVDFEPQTLIETIKQIQ